MVDEIKVLITIRKHKFKPIYSRIKLYQFNTAIYIIMHVLIYKTLYV